jgi:cytoskeletal protein RodZ
MIEIGASLAAARHARGLELRDAERLTCMRSRYLIALEEERYDDLPGTTYARAFLRTYANALDLDADRFVAAFDEQFDDELAEPAFEPVPRSRPRPRRGHWTAAAGVGIVAVVGWAAWSSGPSNRPQPVAAGAAPAAAAAVAPKPHHTGQVLGAHRTVQVKHAPAKPQTLVVSAVDGPCWVQVRRGGATGAVVEERLLQQGQTLRVPLKKAWLRLGAPWNVEVRRGTHVLQTHAHGLPVNVTF